MAEGDSISVFWTGSYTGMYALAHPQLTFVGTAVGGSGLGTPADRGTGTNSLWGRLNADLARDPTHMTVLIGANDMTDWRAMNSNDTNPSEWVTQLFAYTDYLRSRGIKVALGTLLPQCGTSNPSYTQLFNTRRTAANAAIRAAVGTRFDVLIDFAADRRFGEEADACDLMIYSDGVHPTGATQQRMAEVYGPAVDALLQR